MGLLDRLFLVKKIVSREGKVHFRRWRVVQTPWFAVYVHNIARSDEERDLHDHPWPFVSIILRGGYLEKIADSTGVRTVMHAPGSVLFRRAEGEYHKITLWDGPTWSLVFTGPRTHPLWGYKTEFGWVDHITYRGQKYGTETSVSPQWAK